MNAFLFAGYPRIMARVGEHEPVELFRCSRPGASLCPKDIAFATRDLSPAWEWWIERTTDRRELVGSRMIPAEVSHRKYRSRRPWLSKREIKEADAKDAPPAQL